MRVVGELLMRRFLAGAILTGWALLLALILSPLAFGFASQEAAEYTRGIDVSRLQRLGTQSVTMSLRAAGFALLIALPIAIAATRVARRGEAFLLLVAASLPIFIPSTVMALSAVRLFGPTGFFTDWITGGQQTFPVIETLGAAPPTLPGSPIYNMMGCSIVMAWVFYPLVLLAGVAALRRTADDVEEAALLDSGPLRVLGSITLPRALGGLAAGAAAVFIFALTDLGVPEALRSLPVLVAEVYVQFGLFYDTRRALGTAFLLVGLAVVVAAIALGLARIAGFGRAIEQGLLPGSDERALFRHAPFLRWGLRTFAWLFALLLPGIAIGVLLITVDSPQGRLAVWRVTWDTASRELFFTFQLGFVFALVAGVVGGILGAALSVTRRPFAWRLLLLVPMILPAPVIAVGMQILLRLPPGSLPLRLDDALAALSSTLVPLLAAWTLRFAPIVALLVESLLRRVPSELHEVARLEGAGPMRTAWHVAWPFAWPGLAAGMLACFALCLGEVGASVLLLPPGPTTLGVRLFTLMHFAPEGQVSALSLMVLLPGVLAYIAGAVVIAFFARKPAR